MSGPVPTLIRRVDAATGAAAVEITWSDGRVTACSPRQLRDACPCATCRERRASPAPAAPLPILAPQDLAPLAVIGMRPVGRYAYAIDFSDGHASGIYTLDYLRELGVAAAAAGR